MPSAQIALVVETEKKAFQIEQDAKVTAKEIISAENEKAKASISAIAGSADVQIEKIANESREQSERIQGEEDTRAAEMIGSLQKTAALNQKSAIEAAVKILSGRA
jgi:hypothetical protein